MIPVRLATRIVVPDSRNGDVKSTAASLSAFTLRDVSTMSNFLATNLPRFFQIFCGLLTEYVNIILENIT